MTSFYGTLAHAGSVAASESTFGVIESLWEPISSDSCPVAESHAARPQTRNQLYRAFSPHLAPQPHLETRIATHPHSDRTPVPTRRRGPRNPRCPGHHDVGVVEQLVRSGRPTGFDFRIGFDDQPNELLGGELPLGRWTFLVQRHGILARFHALHALADLCLARLHDDRIVHDQRDRDRDLLPRRHRIRVHQLLG